MLKRLTGIAIITLVLWSAFFAPKGPHKPLDVRHNVVSISEIRPSAFVAPTTTWIESLKRKLKKEKLKSLGVKRPQLVLSSEKLMRDVRWLARHGGVTGTCRGCATVRMKQLVKKLIVVRFAPVGTSATQTALCLAGGESDFNPGAISDTNDWGTGQINRRWHESDHPSWWRPHAGFKHAVLDPVYNVGIMFSMSKRGTSWTPWTGTYGQGMCR